MVTLDLNDEQYSLVLDLVESRIRELHPEIRRSRTYTVRDDLQHDLKVLEALRDQLRQSHAPSGTG